MAPSRRRAERAQNMDPLTRLVPPLPAHENVVRAIACMHAVLAAIGWASHEGDSSTNVLVDFGEPHRPIADAVLAIEPEAECFVATFNFASCAEGDRRNEVVRFATRANWELLVGNFEVDLASGAVRFRSSVPFTGGELPESTIRSVIGTAMSVVEAYAEALEDVIDGLASADVALQRVWTRATEVPGDDRTRDQV
jgi:hypothetical protein